MIYGFHSSGSKMLLKSFHSLTSARIHEGILQHCLICFQGKRDAVLLNRFVNGYMYPFAMKDLQKRCLFYHNGTNVYKRWTLRWSVPYTAVSTKVVPQKR